LSCHTALLPSGHSHARRITPRADGKAFVAARNLERLDLTGLMLRLRLPQRNCFEDGG
jgi:hypothetical protein